MIYPTTIKGNIVNNEEELHYLVELDILTPDEYTDLIHSTDTETEEIVQKGRRKPYKALYLDAKEDRDYWFKQYKSMEKKCEELATELLIIKGKKNESN